MPSPLRVQHLLIPAVVAGLLALLGALGGLAPIQQSLYDALLRLRRPAAVQPGILLLDLDDQAVGMAGALPWARSVLADGLVTLREAGARSVLLEVPLGQPSAPGVDPAALRQELPDALSREFSQIEENVQSLFDAIRRGSVQPRDAARYVTDLVGLVSMARVRLSNAATGIERDDDALLGQAAGFFGRTFVPLDLSSVSAGQSVGQPGAQSVGQPGTAEPEASRFALPVTVEGRDPSVRAGSILPPVGPVLRGALGGGFLGTFAGDPAVRRSVPLLARAGDAHYAQVAFAGLLDLLDSPPVLVHGRDIILRNAALPGRPPADIRIPLGDNARMMLDWPRGAGGDGFPHLSWAELIRYRDRETELVSTLRDMDAHGYLSYLRSDTPLLGAYENAARLQRDMLAAGTASYETEWRSARDLFLTLCEQFLGGDAQARILADADRAAASPAITNEERQNIRAASLQVPAAFDSARASFASLREIRDELKRELSGALVIVGPAAGQGGGLAAEGVGEGGATPFGEQASVGAVSAAVVNTILEGRFISPAPGSVSPLLAAALCLLLGLVLHRRKAGDVLVAGLGLAMISAATLAGLLVFAGVSVDPLLPVAGCAVTGMALALYAQGAARARGPFFRAAFSGRVSGGNLTRFLDAPGLMARKGHSRDLAILSVGIRGMAGAGPARDPEAAARTLRAWHAGLSEAVFTQGGVIFGASGGELTACFGVLDGPGDRIVQACRAAMRVRAIEGELGGGPLPLEARMGIDAGPCVVGDLGVRDAARWSAAGPPTDLATRLQALTYRYRVPILVTRAVQEKAAAAFLLRTLDTLPSAATEAPAAVFELVAERDGADAGTVEMIRVFEDGRAMMDTRDWKGALACFTRVLSVRKADGPAALYAERCRQLLEDPARPISWPAW